MRKARKSQLSITEDWLELDHSKELETISRLLDEHPRIAALALQDLQATSALGEQDTGASGMSADQVVRALLVKQMNGFSYRGLAFHLADSLSYRTFCQIGIADTVPAKSTLAENIKALSAPTLEAIHRIIVGAAQSQGVENGRCVRVDCTVVKSNIHHPTDSELLWDGVRVLTRLLVRARTIAGPERIQFHDRTRRAKRRRREINSARRKRQRIKPYRDLIRVAEEVSRSAIAALDEMAEIPSTARLKRVRQDLQQCLDRTQKVIDQARRRVLEGESVPAGEKIVSIFEEHTDIVRKDSRETLYGHKVCLSAGRSCLVLDAQILRGNPPDSSLSVTMIERHQEVFGKPPRQAAFDGGFSSITNLKNIKAQGVKDVAFAKGPGLKVSDMAKSTWVYKRLRDFRAGIEGIISFLKRAFGLDRCTWKSWDSFRAYVWSSIITSNLLIIARASP